MTQTTRDPGSALDTALVLEFVRELRRRWWHGKLLLKGILPELREAVPDTVILADSGVQRGSDVARLMALGADGVLLGRAPPYGLAAGAASMLAILTDERHGSMVFAGARDIGDLACVDRHE